MTPLVVISSCTGDKAVKSPSLTMDDFCDAERLAESERRFAPSQRPAASMYTGFQHVYLMRGIAALQTALGPAGVDLRIVSAGYGLIRSDRRICAYDVTFNDMSRGEARAWAQQLGVPQEVREAIRDADLAIFLLGSRYLDAIEPPIVGHGSKRLVFLAKPSEATRLAGGGVVTVPAGKDQASRYGSGLVALKGKMFELWAKAVANTPELLEATRNDQTPATFLGALE
jgi:uncharacterized protein DUF6884